MESKKYLGYQKLSGIALALNQLEGFKEIQKMI